MTKNINYVASTLKGLNHKINEDAYLVIDGTNYTIFAVFDGVGTAHSAKEATKIAKQFIKNHHRQYLSNSIEINRLMFDVNERLCNSGLDQPYSTYSLVLYKKADLNFYYSWLGDSRIYSITNQFIQQLTTDDSILENVITKFLGNSSLAISDFRQFKKTINSDYLLICTDGFYRVFENNRLAFFEIFLKKRLTTIKYNIRLLVRGKNLDDSTYIFVK